MKRNCVDCGKEFTLTEGEIKFYKSKGLQLPKRCKECRDKKRGGSSRAQAVQNVFADSRQGSSLNLRDKKILGIVAAIAVLIFGVNIGKPFFGSGTVQDNDPAETVYTTLTDPTETAVPEVTADTEETEATEEQTTQPAETAEQPALTTREEKYLEYHFRNNDRLQEHFEKHGMEMGFATAEDYEQRACDIINDPNALYKVEKEDGDGVYFIEDTNEFVVLSTDKYIRTYYICSGRDYFDRQ